MTTHEANISVAPARSRLAPSLLSRIAGWPWWLIAAIGLGIYIIYNILTNPITNRAFWFINGQNPEAIRAGDLVLEGLAMTLGVTGVAYSFAICIGLLMGLGRVSDNVIINNVASFYVEIVRGIPMLVLLMAIAFVGVPVAVEALNSLGETLLAAGIGFGESFVALTSRNISNTWRAIIALAIGYGAFSAEIFRAGIQSIEKGQIEASRALGMGYFQTMRYIVLPQAVRRVLPALGNDFVAMLKDSALVSVLGVRDMTQLNKLYTASTFNFIQGYIVLAFLYLVMTILLSRLVRLMERRMSRSFQA
ncbi:MAG: amino acid ABC transporter permease [Chloroflexota bacterium]